MSSVRDTLVRARRIYAQAPSGHCPYTAVQWVAWGGDDLTAALDTFVAATGIEVPDDWTPGAIWRWHDYGGPDGGRRSPDEVLAAFDRAIEAA